MNNIYFPLATTTWDESEYAAINRVISSGKFTMGDEVLNFEKSFARYFGSKHAVMSNSGSSANLLMVAALFYRKDNPLKRGDEVIVPAVSWSTTYYPLYQYGLKIKFVDIDRLTLNYDLDQLSSAITDNTKLIVAVNLLGNPNDFEAISQIINDREIVLIEDNCESMGAKIDSKFTGTFGLMGSFSTFFSHHISTMEGGVTLTNDEELYHIMLSLRAHGWTRNLPSVNKVSGVKSANSFDESFKFVLPGYNLRPLEFSGAIGQEQLKKLDGLNYLRRKNADYFQSIMFGNDQYIVQKEIGASSWFGFSIIISPKNTITREDLVMKLQHAGIECRPIVAGDFTKNEACRFFNYEIHGVLKNANYLDRNGIFVGNHGYDITSQLNLLKSLL